MINNQNYTATVLNLELLHDDPQYLLILIIKYDKGK